MIPFLKTYTLTTVATPLESTKVLFTGNIYPLLGTVTLSVGNDTVQLTATSKAIEFKNVDLRKISARGVPSGRQIKLVGIIP